MNMRTPLFVLILWMILTSPTFGQISKAKKLMELYNYSAAVPVLEKTISQKDPKTLNEAMLLIAECYRKQNDMLNAKTWYGRAIASGDTEPLNFYFYGQTLRATGEYQKARSMFHYYDSVMPSDKMGYLYEAFCDSAIAWQNNPPAYEVKNATTLNSKQSDFGPACYDNGIIYASDRSISKIEDRTYGWTGNNFLRLYVADPANTDDFFHGFKAPSTAPGFMNQDYHDGPAAFNRSFTEMFLNQTYLLTDKGKKDSSNVRTHLLKIFYATRKNGKWGKLSPFFLNNDEYSVGHPALSPGGDTLYFVSDMKGGSGGTDIYYCIRADGKWGNPVNLGSDINTFGNEMFPYIADNGDLYFASDGHPGFGGLDIFVSKIVDGKWTTPKNLGMPINSSYDDFSLVECKKTGTGLFCSNRPDGIGGDDLYSYNRLPIKVKKLIPPAPPTVSISGCVKDKANMEPIPVASIFLLDDETGKVMVIKTNIQGCFKAKVKINSHYHLKAMQTDYIADCLPFVINEALAKQDPTIPRDLLLDKLAVNRKFKLDNIYYNFDKWDIREDAEPSLNNLVRIMKENPITVELGSHTDSRGSDEYNKLLSQRRAESAVKYIVSTGIDPSRITAHGYGETQLINKCKNGVPCTDAEHQENRRTEFKVTSSFEDKSNTTFNLEKYYDGQMVESKVLPSGFFFNCLK